jgi:hypothetical protein
VAVRKFFLNIGQSNAGPSADAASWWAVHPNLDLRSSDPNIFATNYPRGSYSDTYTFPAGVFPQHGTVNIKGTAIQSLRYLTFYDPMATGYADYPNTMRVATVVGTDGLTSAQYWTSSMVGQTITRRRTGVVYTISAHTAPGSALTVSTSFNPPLEAGEVFTHTLLTTTGGSDTVFTHSLLYGQTFSGGPTIEASLEGMRVKCVALGVGGHAQNLNEIRQIQSISGAFNNTITVATPFPQHVTVGDRFEILPPSGVNSFDRWAYFLPWCPFEGDVNSNKRNPYPKGFNYPQQHDAMPVYNPFSGTTRLWASPSFERAAYHTGLGVRFQEYLGEPIYCVSLSIGGSSIGHRELLDFNYSFGWLDSGAQNYWSPGESNNCFARLLDMLDASVAAAALEGNTLECIGVFWVQGEADSNDLLWSQNYRGNLQRLKTAVRDALVARNLWTGPAATIPWINPKVRSSWTYSANVNAAIEAEADADRYMRTFSTESYLMVDAAHYSGIGITQLEGDAFAAWLQARQGIVQDPSPMVVEDGVGTSSGSEVSYCDADFVGVYLQNQGGNAAWNAATETQRETALKQATFWIDQTYGDRFVGYKYSNSQPLEFPRTLAYDRYGNDITGIPLALKRATAELARRYLEDATQFLADTAAGSNVVADSITVGPISINKTYGGGKDTAKKFNVVDRLFKVAGLIDNSIWADR